MKKSFIAWLKRVVVILVAGAAFLVSELGIFGLIAAGLYHVFVVIEANKPVQVRTDVEPIYNHFPDLPEASEIQWCSKSSTGIGLKTIYIYIFAFYDEDISNELQDMEIKDENEDIELYFVPDGMDVNQKWKHVEDGGFAFQKEIKSTQKMWTNVFINEEGTMLYIEVVGEL